jgi:predicted DNA repair protein MutK
MAAGSLLALLDDIATVLDDVAVMSKVAAKKTSGVLGDDLALNAQQVTGIRAERELPVVWAVTKGSLLNKLILVPSALLISAFFPQAIVWLLMIGGAYLCFEGVEKILHKFMANDAAHSERIEALQNPAIDMVAFEKDKIKGAIRTDFILSAEIIVISLGVMAQAALLTQIITLSFLALAFTFGIYGLVAGIVKLDDVGLWLTEKKATSFGALKHLAGRLLLRLAPRLMRFLSVVGTLAMFLVGGGIIAHHIPTIEHMSSDIALSASYLAIPNANLIVDMITSLLTGITTGLSLVIPYTLVKKIRSLRS